MARTPRKKRRIFRLRNLVILIILGAITVWQLPNMVKAMADRMPDPKELAQPQTTMVYDSQGRLIGRLGEGHREVLDDCKQISAWIPFALLAIEDQGFYNEHGVAWHGVIRAFYTNLRKGHIAQGGSGITQQYVKNAYLTPERSYVRKFKEMGLAAKVEESTPKDKILCNYLNTIYFGRGAYGIQAAAQQYFGKSASKLNLTEAAFIAAIIHSPGRYEGTPIIATSRRNTVLQKMFTEMWNAPNDKYKIQARSINHPLAKNQIWQYPQITDQMMKTAQTSKLKFRGTGKLIGAAASQAPYVMNIVEQYLTEKYGPGALQQGLKVTTTIDLDIQNKIVQEVEQGVGNRTEPRVGVTSMNFGTGGILGMYGGPDIATQQYDAAHDVQRQAGSTMKPVVLAEALEQGIPVSTKYPSPRDLDVTYSGSKQPYHVENYHRGTFGRITLEQAIWHSVNTVYVPLDVQVGPDKVADLAKQMGATDKLLDSDPVPDVQPYPSTALGANIMSTVQAATMYSTLANRGVHNAPYIVEEVKDAKGNVLEKHESDSNRVMDENIADNVNQVLHTNTIHGSAAPARIDIPTAGKTGTSNVVRDMRYNGFTAPVTEKPKHKNDPQPLQITTAVWVGFSNNKTLSDNLPDPMTPKSLWKNIMASITAGHPGVDFPTPKAIKVKQTPKPEPTPTVTPSSPSPTPTQSDTPTPTPTPTETPSSTPTPTPTPTRTQAESPTPSVTPSSSPSQRKPATPTPTPAATPQVVQANNGTPSPSQTPTGD